MTMVEFSIVRTFQFPTIVRFGVGASNEVADYLLKNQLKKPLVVTDPNIMNLPFFKVFVKNLLLKSISVEIFSETHKNPIKSDVYLGVEKYDATQRDCIIGIGGGVAMDVARAITLRVTHREDLFVYDDLKGGDQFVVNEVPHFITIPTTAGTGSEVGRSAIIADDQTKNKKILFSPKLMAKICFADPQLTMDLPPHITAATGMDAFTHLIEAFLSKNYHPICDGIALEGITMVGQSLETAVNSPNIKARSTMLLASLMGAIAFQKGLGIVHSLAHPLSALIDMHHGLANAVNLPFGLEFNHAICKDKFSRIAQALSLGTDDNKVIPYIRDLNQTIGIPARLSLIGVKSDHIESLSQLAIDDFCHPNNPQPVTKEDFKHIYLKAL